MTRTIYTAVEGGGRSADQSLAVSRRQRAIVLLRSDGWSDGKEATTADCSCTHLKKKKKTLHMGY